MIASASSELSSTLSAAHGETSRKSAGSATKCDQSVGQVAAAPELHPAGQQGTGAGLAQGLALRAPRVQRGGRVVAGAPGQREQRPASRSAARAGAAGARRRCARGDRDPPLRRCASGAGRCARRSTPRGASSRASRRSAASRARSPGSCGAPASRGRGRSRGVPRGASPASASSVRAPAPRRTADWGRARPWPDPRGCPGVPSARCAAGGGRRSRPPRRRPRARSCLRSARKPRRSIDGGIEGAAARDESDMEKPPSSSPADARQPALRGAVPRCFARPARHAAAPLACAHTGTTTGGRDMGEYEDKFTGKAKEVYGVASGDRRVEAEGKAQHGPWPAQGDAGADQGHPEGRVPEAAAAPAQLLSLAAPRECQARPWVQVRRPALAGVPASRSESGAEIRRAGGV